MTLTPEFRSTDLENDQDDGESPNQQSSSESDTDTIPPSAEVPECESPATVPQSEPFGSTLSRHMQPEDPTEDTTYRRSKRKRLPVGQRLDADSDYEGGCAESDCEDPTSSDEMVQCSGPACSVKVCCLLQVQKSILTNENHTVPSFLPGHTSSSGWWMVL
jgi:hypothetical protein